MLAAAQASLLPALAVFGGSAAGGVARFWLSEWCARRLGTRFPWGTLAVNASGALVLGFVAALGLDRGGLAWQFGALGLLGSYTTVSSFSLQTLALAHDRAWGRVALNIGGSLLLCLGGVAVGWMLGAGTWGGGP